MVIESIPDQQTVVCIAGGPSLTRADCEYAEGKAFLIGVNDAYRIANLDVLYASDYPWWARHWEQVKDLPLRRIGGQQERKDKPDIELLPAKNGCDLTDSVLNYGQHSGFAALHLAVLLGARRVLLLGYDSRAASKRHWFGDHPKGLNVTATHQYSSWAQTYAKAKKPDIDIINCSRNTAISCFPRATITDVL